MPTLRFESVVRCPIAEVWAAFQDVQTLLPAITPPPQQLRIESVAPLPPQVGTLVTMSVKGPFGRVGWTARYAAFVPPHATVTGIEARFVDEQVTGPFKRFVQSHEFEAASDLSTRCIDVIHYAAPLGILGRLGDIILLRHLLRRTFRYRHHELGVRLGKASLPR